MSTKTITQCDVCHRELDIDDEDEDVWMVVHGEQALDFCSGQHLVEWFVARGFGKLPDDQPQDINELAF